MKEDPEKYAEHRRRNRISREKSIAKKPEVYHAKRKAVKLRHLYGLTTEEARQFWQDQGGLCAICERPITDPSIQSPSAPNRAHIDHCHVSGAVRGILCGDCNRLLGLAKDDPRILLAAVAYLGRHLGDAD